MSDWIDDLKRQQEAKELKQGQEQEWRLRCDRLIAAMAPGLWQAFMDRVDADVKELAQKCPNNDSMHLLFSQDSENRFTVTSASGNQNFTACWFPDARVIDLEFRSRADIFSSVQTVKARIEFFVNAKDEVGIAFYERKTPEAISEILIKRLL